MSKDGMDNCHKLRPEAGKPFDQIPYRVYDRDSEQGGKVFIRRKIFLYSIPVRVYVYIRREGEDAVSEAGKPAFPLKAALPSAKGIIVEGGTGFERTDRQGSGTIAAGRKKTQHYRCSRNRRDGGRENSRGGKHSFEYIGIPPS